MLAPPPPPLQKRFGDTRGAAEGGDPARPTAGTGDTAGTTSRWPPAARAPHSSEKLGGSSRSTSSELISKRHRSDEITPPGDLKHFGGEHRFTENKTPEKVACPRYRPPSNTAGPSRLSPPSPPITRQHCADLAASWPAGQPPTAWGQAHRTSCPRRPRQGARAQRPSDRREGDARGSRRQTHKEWPWPEGRRRLAGEAQPRRPHPWKRATCPLWFPAIAGSQPAGSVQRRKEVGDGG